MLKSAKKSKTDNLNIRIEYFKKLIKPNELREKLVSSIRVNDLVCKTRNEIANIISGEDDRLLFIVGPCSIHNIDEAKKYGDELKLIADKVKDKILVVMRVYFEKPRSTVGWKGLINDPDLDNSYDVNNGLYKARELLLYLNNIGVPCGYEILDTITPQYISDLISWGAIGARTSESQVHRQLVSGLSMPVGFKNNTSGNIKVSVDSVISASYPHCFMGITDMGEPAICKTKGNNNCHIILRGSNTGPNYKKTFIRAAEKILKSSNVETRIMVDCSHGNSGKNYKKQSKVLKNIIQQKLNKNKSIMGVMIESNINEGSQKLTPPDKLLTGVSITDSCIGLEETHKLLVDAYNNTLCKII